MNQAERRRCHGKDADDIVLKVPEGTVIKEAESGKVIADMSGDNRQSGHLKRWKRRTWKSAFCDSDYADSEVCTAWTAGKRADGKT